MSPKIYLRVPFVDKERAKIKGAKWCPLARQWYVPSGKNIVEFSEWMGAKNGAPDRAIVFDAPTIPTHQPNNKLTVNIHYELGGRFVAFESSERPNLQPGWDAALCHPREFCEIEIFKLRISQLSSIDTSHRRIPDVLWECASATWRPNNEEWSYYLSELTTDLSNWINEQIYL